MTSFTGRFLLDGVVVPAVTAFLIMLPTRWWDRRVFYELLPPIALLIGLLSTYWLIFGWPGSLVPSARQKIILLAAAGLFLGTIHHRNARRAAFAALITLTPFWIGLPSLAQGQPKAVLLALPALMGLGVLFVASTRPYQDQGQSLAWSLAALALGLAAIALFGRSASLSQLSLALASALAAILLTTQKPPPHSLILTVMVLASGLLTTLLLYTDASLTAAVLLALSPLAPLFAARLAKVATRDIRAALTGFLLVGMVVLVAVIAWIDGGHISLYEGAQRDGVILQRFVQAGNDGHDWKNF